MRTPLYRWADGTTAFLVVASDSFGISVSVGSLSVELTFMNNPPALYLERPSPDRFQREEDKPLGAKLRGLALDLGIRHFHPAWHGLVLTRVLPPAVLSYPTWVEEKEWASRYDVARTRVVDYRDDSPISAKGPLVGHVSDVFIRHEARAGYYLAVWNTMASQPYQLTRPSLEAVVDAVLAFELVRPTSARAAWEAAHLERGEFVLPSPDEVEVFRLVGEELPFFWGRELFEAWLSERGTS